MPQDTVLRSFTDAPRKPLPIAHGVVLTVICWVVDRFLIGISWEPTRNPFTFNPNDWIRWDSFNYVNIAAHGTTIGRCGTPGFVGRRIWCGTAGWLPGYPWILRLAHATGMSLVNAGLAVSWIALMTAMFLVWYGWCRELAQVRAFLLILLFGVFPGAVYNFALFPTSLALCFIIAAILCAMSERWFFTALLLIFAGLCYPTAWFAAAGIAAAGALIGLPLGAREAVRRALWGLAGLLSIVVLMSVDEPGNAFFLMDTQAGQTQPGLPGAYFLRLLFMDNTIEQKAIGTFAGALLAVQGAFAVLMAVVAAVLSLSHGRWRDPKRHMIYPAMVGVLVTLGVLAVNASGGAWNRSIVLAAPCVLCFRHVPTWVLSVMFIAVATVTVLLSHSFFIGTMV